MRKLFFHILLITGMMANQEPQVPDDLIQLTESIAEFTRDLYDQFNQKNPGGNIFFSPLSIATAMGLAHAGARGNTAAQMAAALKLHGAYDHTSFQKLLRSLKTPTDQYILSIANGVFVDKKFKALEEYINLAKSSFESEVTEVNFLRDSEGSRATINQWVENETNSKITDLVPSGVLTPQTALILVNAVYFKAQWERIFSPHETEVEPFQTEGKTVQVEMMYQEEDFPIGDVEELDCQVLELPYVQNELSMFILLPRRPDGLAQLEERLTPAILRSISSYVEVRNVEVFLPKFTLQESSDLRGFLNNLGIIDLFSANGDADLSGIDGTTKLYVSNVVHQSFIEVNEKGSGASAAAAGEFKYTSYQFPVEFNANHPFMFIIRHRITGVVLFVGRLSLPEEAFRASDVL